MTPGYITFMESKSSSAMFLDSEIRLIKKYCNDNDGIVRFNFVGDSQVANMQFGPSLYDRVELIRRQDCYRLRLKSNNVDVNNISEDFTSFKEALKFLEEES